MDVLVIGGGVRVCTAYYLAEQGAHVTLVERGDIAGADDQGRRPEARAVLPDLRRPERGHHGQGADLRAGDATGAGLRHQRQLQLLGAASIAYGYLPVERAAEGTPVQVYYYGERYPATVRKEPLYDPDNTKLKA